MYSGNLLLQGKYHLDIGLFIGALILFSLECPWFCRQESIADWKNHKTNCNTNYAARLKQEAWKQGTVHSWLERYLLLVLEKLDRVMRERSAQLQDLGLELDFFVENGIAPALKEPCPDFKISLVKEYLNHDSHGESGWISNVIKDQHNLGVLRGHCQEMTNPTCEKWAFKEFLVMARLSNGEPFIHRMRVSFDAEAEMPMFCEGTVEAFARALRGDYSRLDQVFPPSMVLTIKAGCNRSSAHHAVSKLADDSFDFDQWIEGLDETELEQFLAEVYEGDTEGLNDYEWCGDSSD